MAAIQKPSAQKKGEEQPPLPDVEVGDEVYFRHPEGGPQAGMIASFGRHGCHVDCQGRRYQVLWEHMLGHKLRVKPGYSVVDEGEDGMIVEEPAGRRRYIHDPDSESEFSDVEKSLMPRALIFGGGDMIMKAMKGKGVKGRPGLTLRKVTDKNGKQSGHWVKNGKDQPKQKVQKEAPEAGSKQGYGTHNLSAGDKVWFKTAKVNGSGEIVGKPGKDGAYVRDKSGKRHKVLWSEVTKHKPGKSVKKHEVQPTVLGKQKPVPAEKFKAADYAKEHDDSKVTPDSILSQYPEDTRKKIKDVQQRLLGIEETIARFKDGDKYKVERQEIHRNIWKKFLSPEAIAAATPPPGEKPTFTMLGGRGGSGKSFFSKDAESPVDTKGAVVLDADEIKKLIPGYEGWNAHEVHEESSDILEMIEEDARLMGLNIVLDATMKTASSALKRVKKFKESGYRIEAHYMHLPRQEAAKRAVGRFLDKEQRYVPVERVLENTTNEASFDEVRQHADKWSFRDNNVPRGHKPILISQSG